MKVLFKAGFTALALASFVSTPIMAQAYRWDASINGGGTVFTNLLGSNDDIITNASLIDTDAIKFRPSWIAGGQLGYWFARNFGVRANFAYSAPDFRQGDIHLFDDINVWNGTGDLLFRFVKPNKEWKGTEVLPYFAAGLGATWVNPPGNAFIEVDDGFFTEFPETFPVTVEGRSGIPVICRVGICNGPATPGFPGIGGIPVLGERTLFLKEGAKFAGLLGLGADFRFAPNFAVRLEVGDRIWKAPFDEVATEENVFFIVRKIDEIGKTINQFYGTLGLAVPFGLIHVPKAVAVRPAPAPPPPPPPPPPPATETITVCVVDVTAPTGLAVLTGERNLQTGDTTVIRSGVATPISAAVGNVIVAGSADWFVRGEPLGIGTDKNKLIFLPVGSSRVIDANELDFIGTVNGLAVYVDRTVKTGALAVLGPNTDVTMIVNQNKGVHDALDKVTTLYVPASGSGCVFQEMARQQAVRK